VSCTSGAGKAPEPQKLVADDRRRCRRRRSGRPGQPGAALPLSSPDRPHPGLGGAL